jgi:hypothetical protein
MEKNKQKFSEKSKGNYFETVKSLMEALQEVTDCVEKSVTILESLDKRLQILEGKYAKQGRSR